MRALFPLALAGLLLAGPSPFSDQTAASSQQTAAKPPAPTASAQGAPARDARGPAPAGTGIIRGRILATENGAPLRRASVSLSGDALPTARMVPSDLDGRFEFQYLPPGRFSLQAGKTGYVTLGYGQRRPFQAGKPIELAEGQVVGDLSLSLPPGAVIAGRVVNDVGEPASGLYVVAVRPRYVNGRRELRPAGRSTQTDDLGQYRISGLAPASYYVATMTGGSRAARGTVIEEGLALVQTYYPGTANAAEGKPVTVRLGQEVRGIDIPLVASRASSVSGTVVDSRGRPAATQSVTLRPAGLTIMSLLNTTNASSQPSGAFVAPSLMPGDYILHAAVRTPDAGEQESADVPVTVGINDIEGLVITTAPNGRIVGRVILDSEAKPTFSPGSLRVSASASSLVQAAPAQVGATWEFELKNVEPGKLDLSVDPMPAGWAIKRIVAGGRDVTEATVEVTAATATTVEVTLTDRPTVLSGTVNRPPGQPALDDYTVVVFSDNPAHWREGSKRLTVARPDQHGAFRVVGLPPGRYRAIAVEYLDLGEQWNPEFLGWAHGRGTLIELADGETVKANLEVTKYAN